MNKTPIQWTDYTVNPFRFRNLETGKVGHHCEKISPGCKFCYSAKMQTGPYLSGLDFIAENKPKGEFFLDEAVLQQVLRRKKPARIFWCDMTDMFLEDYPAEWIDRCFAVMALTPHLTHQVLTKRARRMREYFTKEIPLSERAELVAAQAAHTGKIVWDARGSERHNYFGCGQIGDISNRRAFPGWPLPNVWLGVSCEDQQRADERIPDLIATPAAVRFLSVEPMLGPVDLRRWLNRCEPCDKDRIIRSSDGTHARCGRNPGINWVIVGGESGHDARPCDIAWVRSIVEQCAAAGVHCFVKQLGALPCGEFAKGLYSPAHDTYGKPLRLMKDPKGGDMEKWPSDLRVREMPEVRA